MPNSTQTPKFSIEFIGFPGSGKSTVANEVHKHLMIHNLRSVIIGDTDNFSSSTSSPLSNNKILNRFYSYGKSAYQSIPLITPLFQANLQNSKPDSNSKYYSQRRIQTIKEVLKFNIARIQFNVDIILHNQSLLQSISSMTLFGQNSCDAKLFQLMSKKLLRLESQSHKYICIHLTCDPETTADRIKTREKAWACPFPEEELASRIIPQAEQHYQNAISTLKSQNLAAYTFSNKDEAKSTAEAIVAKICEIKHSTMRKAS